MNYNVDFFINKFEAIPEDRWCVHTVTDEYGRHCAWGHLESYLGDSFLLSSDYPMIKSFTSLFKKYGLNKNGDPGNINNGRDKRYQQPTPKQRILAALYDIKKSKYPELSETTVEELISENVT